MNAIAFENSTASRKVKMSASQLETFLLFLSFSIDLLLIEKSRRQKMQESGGGGRGVCTNGELRKCVNVGNEVKNVYIKSKICNKGAVFEVNVMH